MGTDIRTFAELHDADGWKPIPEPVWPRKWEPVEAVELGRSYPLFSVLCGNPVSIVARNDEREVRRCLDD